MVPRKDNPTMSIRKPCRVSREGVRLYLKLGGYDGSDLKQGNNGIY